MTEVRALGEVTGALETGRLVLERWDERHLDDFVRLAADPRVARYVADGDPWTRDRATARFAEALGHWSRYGFGWRSAIERATGAWVGFVGLNFARPEAIELAPRSVEIGWWIDPSRWRRGLATEGAVAVRDEAFARVGVDRLWARYQTSNPASARVAEKIGLRAERVARSRSNRPVQVVSLAIEDWARLPQDYPSNAP
ncbi:MAG: GNAT family N-acetyltransferase [Actinobacteria bacterium]|nr:GNAT family N-acetyltransferase [Actinomycetota bacterium]